MFARNILVGIESCTLPSPTVCPVTSGDIAVIWSVGSKQLEIIFGPDRTGSFVLTRGEEITDSGDIADRDSTALERALNDLLRA
jgi:hypothetical protein